jgi:hypothetical protein
MLRFAVLGYDRDLSGNRKDGVNWENYLAINGVGPTGLIDTEGNLSEKGAGNAQSAISPLESAN